MTEIKNQRNQNQRTKERKITNKARQNPKQTRRKEFE